jgi:hypothetical protein
MASEVRRLVGDSLYQELEDEDVARALDANSRDVRYLPLVPAETIAPGGGVSFLDYYAPHGAWEAGAQLVDASFNPLTPAAQDLLVGRWTFSSSVTPPVMLVGRTFDLHAAAADLLEQYAAMVKCEYDADLGGDSYRRSQKGEAALRLAGVLRRRQRPIQVPVRRSDAMPD